MQIEIGPGEEKLGQAFDMIVTLQKFTMALAQRIEVDSILISLLLDRVEDPQVALQHWQTKMADYYPERAVDLLGNEYMEESSEELKRRISLWTQVLEARAQAAQD
ncbi:hypothetical protein [Lysobacter capsici]|uniref:hypothetical protein n=1 Tax=Lysobacter capsici TaxID=435897 RepID=UPI000A819DAE|nr:hypothetical protein [Lysobacter capsici]